jgi:hypothetical protein
MKNALAILLLLPAITVASAPRAEVRTPVELAAAVGDARALEIRLPYANLELTAGAGDRVAATGTMETLHKDPQRARDLAQGCGLAFRMERETLVLEPRAPVGVLGNDARKGGLWFHLRLSVPASLPLTVHSKAGDVTLRGGFRADLAVEAGHGDIVLDFAPAYRELDARTVSGRVRGLPDSALKRFYYSPVGQRRLWLDPAGAGTAYFKTLRGDIILPRKDKP